MRYQVEFLLPLKLQKIPCSFGLWPQNQDFLLDSIDLLILISGVHCYNVLVSFVPKVSFLNLNLKSKIKFREACNRCKRVLGAGKVAYANKTKESITSQKLGSRDFRRIFNIVFSKGKFAIHPLFNGLEVFSSASDKANCLLKTFLTILILMTQVSPYLFSLLKLIWNCIVLR